MSRLLFIYEFETPTSSSMRQFYIGMEAKGVLEKVSFIKIKNVTSKHINNADVVVLVRATDPFSVHIAEKCHKAGKFVVAFYDDDLMNRPTDRPIISWRKNNVKRLLLQSNVVFSSSHRICEKFKHYTIEKRGIVTDTAVYDWEFRSNKKTQSDTVRIVYAANSSHAPLFKKYIEPSIPALRRINKNIEFTFIGVHPKILQESLPVNVRVNYVNGMPFLEYRKFMDSHDFDVGLAPLESDEFSKCKYINKFIEYSIFQIPCIFSNTEPYTSVVRDGENGYLVDNTIEAWERAICSVINDRIQREQCGINAIAMVRDKFNTGYIIKNLIRKMPEFRSFKTTDIDVGSLFFNKIEYIFARLSENLFLIWKYFRTSGILGLVHKVTSHIKGTRDFHRIPKKGIHS